MEVVAIVDTAIRVYSQRRNVVFLDGARERVIEQVNASGAKFKNEVIGAIESAIKSELDFSASHPFLESMLYDMGV